MAIDGLTPFTGQITQGLRGNVGGENAFWGIDPKTGREVPVLYGNGGAYLLSDLMQKFGSIDAIRNYGANPNAFVPDGDTQGYATQGAFAQSLDNFGARPSNDFLSGKDGLNDAFKIAAMAAPVVAGAAGAFGAAGSTGAAGTAAGDAAIGGGEGAISGSGAAETGASMDFDPSWADEWSPAATDAYGGTPDFASFADEWSPAAVGDSYGSAQTMPSMEKIVGLAKTYGLPLAQVLKMIGPAALGALGSSKQASSLNDLSGRYEAYGAPSRVRFESSMTPGFDPTTIPGYSGAVDSASKSILAKLSATGGNPFGNPGGLIDANKQIISGTALPAVQEYQRLNANTGFGNSMNASGTYGAQAIGAQGNVFNAVGAGINDAVNPPKSLAEQLAEYEKARKAIGGGANSLQ